MARAGDSGDALEAARRLLAVRDAELAEADRALAAVIARAHGIAVESIGRIDAIASAIEAAAADHPRDSAAQGREMTRHLVAKNREIADLVSAARDAVEARTLELQELSQRYRR